MKRNIIFLSLASMLLSSIPAYAESPLKIFINNESIDSPAFISEDNDSTYVPVRSVFEAMGCEVNWDNTNKTAEIAYKDNKLTFSQYSSDNIKIVNDRMYLPLRAVSEDLGFEVTWNEEDKSININEAVNYSEYTNSNTSEIYELNSSSGFALKLNELMPNDQNYVFSPISLKYLLAMAANGADDETKGEITKAFEINDLDKFNDDVKEYLSTLTLEKLDDDFGDDYNGLSSGVSLNIADSIWLNEDYIKNGDFSDNFKSLVLDKYNAAAEGVNNENAVEKINNWCAENTNQKVTNIINNNDFIACLVNAVYFNGKWSSLFDEDETKKALFTDRNSEKTEIDFINQTGLFEYYADKNIKIISMPYQHSDISMYFALTDDKAVDFERYIEKMEEKEVKISIPKFKTEYSSNAVDIIKSLGIEKAFDTNSNAYHFKDMFNDTVNNAESIYISDILQKAYIDVNEEGTEAAAIAAFTMTGGMDESPDEIYEFKADKPFTYFIRDDKTGEILFMGEYAFAE